MLKELHTSKSARFFQLHRPLRKNDIIEYFNDVLANRANSTEEDRQVKRTRTVNGQRIRLSHLLFHFEEPPSFLRNTVHRERKFGYILFVELPNTLVIFGRHTTFPDDLFHGFVDPLPFDVSSRLFVNGQTEYERISVRNMTVSDHEVKAAAYEARNLQGVLSNIILSRMIPRSLRIKSNASTVLLTPNTSRVGTLGGRSEFRKLMEWCIDVDLAISGFAHVDSFLDSFATPRSLSTLDGSLPTGILFYLDDLESEVLEHGEASIWRSTSSGVAYELSKDQVNTLFKRFRAVLEVQLQPNGDFAVLSESGRPFATLVIGKTITIRSRQLGRYEIRRAASANEAVTRYVNSSQAFVVNFDDPRLAYFSRNLFEDRALLGNVPHFIEALEGQGALSSVTSEKGSPVATDTEFPMQSVFRVVEDLVRGQGVSILFCDDIDDEWADHIAVWEDERRIAYIHSKYYKTHGLSASAFQDVVGQGLKNLGRIRSRRNEYLGKIQNRWSQNYTTGKGTQTSIPRIREGLGNAIQLAERVVDVATSPSARREVWLVTNWLSIAQVYATLNALANNQQGGRHETQLLWLLSAFVSGCQSAGVIPKIVCRP